MSGTVNLSDAGTRMLIVGLLAPTTQLTSKCRPPRNRAAPALRVSASPAALMRYPHALPSSLQVRQRSGCKHAFDVESSPQQLRVNHQGHQPASGYRQLRCGSAEHPKIFVAGRYMKSLLCLEELLSGRLLANAHAMRRILGLTLHVIDRIEPAGKQRLYCLGRLFQAAGTHRQDVDDLTRNPSPV